MVTHGCKLTCQSGTGNNRSKRDVTLSILAVAASDSSHRQVLGLGHVRQVQSFIRAAGPALHSVITINVEVSQEEHWRQSALIPGEDIAAVLGPFAHACPNLRRLTVTGDVGAPLLAAFGSCCSSLTTLETTDVAVRTLETISELLPGVTSTQMTLFHDDCSESDDEEDERLGGFQSALSSCLTLTRLDTGGKHLTDASWRALPACIQELNICTPCEEPHLQRAGPPAGVQLPNLRTLETTSHNMPLCLLAGVLRVAPQLQRLAVNGVFFPCTLDRIPDLELVHARLSNGLVIKPCRFKDSYLRKLPGGDDGKRLLLCLSGLEDTQPGSPAALFLSRLPVLPLVVGVHLNYAERPVCVSLARAFPGLRAFRLYSMIPSAGIPTLTVFPRLQILRLCESENELTVLELEALCMQIPSLLFLSVPQNRAACRLLMDTLQTAGRAVTVDSHL